MLLTVNVAHGTRGNRRCKMFDVPSGAEYDSCSSVKRSLTGKIDAADDKSKAS